METCNIWSFVDTLHFLNVGIWIPFENQVKTRNTPYKIYIDTKSVYSFRDSQIFWSWLLISRLRVTDLMNETLGSCYSTDATLMLIIVLFFNEEHSKRYSKGNTTSVRNCLKFLRCLSRQLDIGILNNSGGKYGKVE